MLRKWLRSWIRPWRNSPQWEQQVVLRGLGAPVELRQAASGVPHLFAKSEEDLFRAQGFVTARDRLFQLDTARRATAGRLAEWYGDVPGLGLDPVLHLRGQGLASVDYLMRIFGFQQAAEDGIAWISPKSYRALLAYSEGVNEWIALARKKGWLPLGYHILDTTPEEWRPTDSLLLLRLLGFRLSFTWRMLLAFGAVCHRLQDAPEQLASMLPEHLDMQTGALEAMLNEVDLSMSSTQDDAMPGPHTESVMPSGTGQGSCAWVVSGQKTRSGLPILCNDPHLALRLPGAFYQVRLHGGRYDTIGLSIPGHPGIYAGHNQHIAWGASLSRVDDADIFLESLTPSGEQYRHKERLLPLVRREEVIRVRNEKPRHRWVRATLHGPLLSDALRGPMPTHLAYSLGWTGQEGVRETEAILQLNKARDWKDFRQALRSARVPSLGFVYADRKGNIGGMIAGRCPQRTHSPRLFHPLPAAEGKYDWRGETPFEELPFAYNPPEGYLILSGQRPKAPLSPHELQGIWEPDYRSNRIAELLERKVEDRPNADYMGRLQRDTYSLWSRDLIARELGSYDPGRLSPDVRGCFTMLQEWNGRLGTESLAATFFTMFQLKLMEQAYQPALGDDLHRRWLEIAHEFGPPAEALFRAPDAWFERGRDAAIHFALTQAYHTLQKRLGPDPNDWTWSRLHKLHLRPIFFWDSALLQKFHRGPYGTGGDAISINAGTHTWSRPFEHRVGAAARLTLDVGQWDQSLWVTCGGQSEDPDSPLYDDQLAHWLRGDAIPMTYAPTSLHTAPVQWLQPKEQPTPTSYLEALAPYQPLPTTAGNAPSGAKERE